MKTVISSARMWRDMGMMRSYRAECYGGFRMLKPAPLPQSFGIWSVWKNFSSRIIKRKPLSAGENYSRVDGGRRAAKPKVICHRSQEEKKNKKNLRPARSSEDEAAPASTPQIPIHRLSNHLFTILIMASFIFPPALNFCVRDDDRPWVVWTKLLDATLPSYLLLEVIVKKISTVFINTHCLSIEWFPCGPGHKQEQDNSE